MCAFRFRRSNKRKQNIRTKRNKSIELRRIIFFRFAHKNQRTFHITKRKDTEKEEKEEEEKKRTVPNRTKRQKKKNQPNVAFCHRVIKRKKEKE